MVKTIGKVNKDTVLPIPKVEAFWKHDFSKYPDFIKVAMTDGKVITYDIRVEQPAPVMTDALDRFDKACGYPPKEKTGC